MHPDEFFEALEAYQDKSDADRRHIGELVRGATLRMFNLELKKDDRITDPRKFWMMPWDESPEDENAEAIRQLEALSSEERERQAREFLKTLK